VRLNGMKRRRRRRRRRKTWGQVVPSRGGHNRILQSLAISTDKHQMEVVPRC